jgi:hypothetical protein
LRALQKRTWAHYKSHKIIKLVDDEFKLKEACFELLFESIDDTFCSRRSAGSAFLAAGPAYEKERSPNFERSLGMT